MFKKYNTELVFSSTNKLKNKLGCSCSKDRVNDVEKSGIYEISCNDCDEIDIGQTRRNIATRFKEHVNMRAAVKTAVGEHIIENNHRISLENLKLVKNVTNTFELDAYESLYMHKDNEKLMNTLEAPIQSSLFRFGVI